MTPELTAAAEWMKYYYAHPQPQHFVENVRRFAGSGALADPSRQFAMATFFGRVMAANPKQIRPWMTALADLKGGDLLILRTAAWISNTPEARAYLTEVDTEKQFAKAPPDMLESAMRDLHALSFELSAAMLDVFWSYYHATGDARAIRGVVSALEYSVDSGAAQRFRASKQTEEDKKAALRDALFQAAAWSLEGQMREHPPLLKMCKEIAADKSLKPAERAALVKIVQKVEG